MPINLRYGQQAVARGFLTSQRLQQVLAKQRQLADQGKKVSVRMILEKAKLLDAGQLQQIDRDLNIKVVKKHTGKVQRPGTKPPPTQQAPAGAQNFAGEAVPQFSGMEGEDPDATVFSPPPPEMQDMIRAEREKAKQDARLKQEQEAAAFMGDDSGSPFGEDPFAGDAMSPEPAGFGNEMQPEPMDAGFGNEMQPEPMNDGGFGGEMQPEPFGGGDLQPQADAFGDDSGSPFGEDPFAGGGDGNQPAELDRMDSSPKLSSLPAEFDGFASPDDEQLPTVGGFDDMPPPQQFDAAPQQQQFAAGPDLSPDAGDQFSDFGNDIRSPEELESSPAKGPPAGDPMDATMFSPPPPGTPGGRQKTGAMDRTVFSPRPPEMGGAQPMDAEPEGDNWGEDAGFGAEPFADEPMQPAAEADNMDATVFSPPPPGTPGTGQVDASGRQGADDFGDVDIPQGRVIDDVPTAPASIDDDIHPIRRGVGTSSASVSKSQPQPQPPAYDDEDVADELPDDGGVEIPGDEPVAAGPKLPGKGLPGKGLPGKKSASKRELPQQSVEPEPSGKKEKKGAGKRMLLIFVILLLILLAILVLPVALYDQVEQVRPLRDHRSAKPIYDYVEDIYTSIPGLESSGGGGGDGSENAAPANTPDNAPADNSAGGNAPEADGGEGDAG